MAFVFDEKLSTKWFDSLTVIPDDGDNVWFIVEDKIHIGKYIAEAKSFMEADKSLTDLGCVRQWSPLNGVKEVCRKPQEGQIIAAEIPGLPCYVLGIFSDCLGENLLINGPGLLLDKDYNISELNGVQSPVSWDDVFSWYELPQEPLLLLPVISVDLVPVPISNIGDIKCAFSDSECKEEDSCCDSNCNEKDNKEQITSAIVACKNKNLIEKNIEDRPMNNKLTETRVSYELTQYGSYQPWGQAKEAWQYILDNGKFDEFDQLLEEWYPEGIDETSLNDILAYEPETVYPYLGLRDPYNKDVTEDDFDGTTELETVNDIVLCDVDEDNEFADILEFFAKDMGLSEEDAKKVLTDKGYIKDNQLIIPAGKLCTVTDTRYAYEVETSDFPVSFEVSQPDTSDFRLSESKKSDNKITERIHKKNYSDKLVGYFEPGEDEELIYDGRHAGYISDGQAYLRRDCPKEVYEMFPDYIETNFSFLEESKRHGKRLKEDYGWEVKSGEAWDLLDELVEALGPEEMLTALAKAIGTYELEDNLAFICRQYDFRSQHLTNFEDEEDEEDLEESKKKLTERKVGNLDENVKEWYLKAHSQDDLGPKLNDDFTFKDVYIGLGEGKDVYDIFGVGDSLVRQHIFYELSKRLRVDNSVMLSLWLGDYGNQYGESKKIKDMKLKEAKSDGWPEEVVDAFNNVFDDVDRFQYEVRNCVRGCYTGVDDMEGLTDAARKIGEEWMEVVDNDLQYIDDPDIDLDESKKSDNFSHLPESLSKKVSDFLKKIN